MFKRQYDCNAFILTRTGIRGNECEMHRIQEEYMRRMRVNARAGQTLNIHQRA